MPHYVTRMLRFGDPERHSYIIGVYSSLAHAKLAGAVEESWRGGKYEYIVEEFELDSTVSQEKYNNHYRCHGENNG